MMTRPAVAVLLAAFNEERTLTAAVCSVLEQTLPDWQLLIVDDASSDGTDEVVRVLRAQDDRVRSIRNPRRLGLAGALNRGLAACGGELVARLDADDLCAPDRLRLQAEFLVAHRDVGVLGSGALLVEGDVPLGPRLRPESHETLVERIFRENPFFHPSVMVRREFYERHGGYDERLVRAQDYDLWLRGYRTARYHNLQQPLITYRLRARPRLDALLYGSFMLARAARREGRLLTKGVYAARFLAAGLAMRVGLFRGGLR